MRIRPAREEDFAFMREMGYEAAMWRPHVPRPPIDDVLSDPHIGRYLSGWGRPGDTALIAEDETGARLGAAWYRLFSDEEPGFGFVDTSTPELSIGVRADARGGGVGTRLLEALADRARADNFRALSLSVEVDNPALRLYERAGFRVIERSKHSATMLLELR